MASKTYAQLVSGTTRVGVDTRKRENSEVLRSRRGDNLSVEAITGSGNPAVTNWGDMMTGMPNIQSTGVSRCVRSPLGLYSDMADEPWKYGDDVFEWLELDDKLRAGPERAAVETYWADREALQQAEQAREEAKYKVDRKKLALIANQAAKAGMKRWVERDIRRFVTKIKGSATKIQALVRGYQTRCKNPHLDCCMCLSHRMSPLKTSVGFMCRECAAIGPHWDMVDNDPWNWHRADYEDMVVVPKCVWCEKNPAVFDDYCSMACGAYDNRL